MPTRGLTLIWLLLTASTSAFGVIALTGEISAIEWWLLPAIVGVPVISVLLLIPPIKRAVAPVISLPRRLPHVYWLLILIYLCVAISIWLISYQPTYGRWLFPAEIALLSLLAWLLLTLFVYGFTLEQARAMGARLANGALTGILITLTTLVVLLFAVEGYLRVFYITTDAYGFTAMNYHWYQNFMVNDVNALGFRDYEPLPDARDLTRIAVVGDSFAVGHGIDDKDDTFAQRLDVLLGEGYDVNLVAKSGWDTDVYLGYLMQYPHTPDVVILSYYLNDIDWLLDDSNFNPNANFAIPEDNALRFFVLNYFTVNYFYYVVGQFNSTQRTSGFAYDLIGAHLDDDIWARQQEQLDNFAWYTREQNMRLIVLVWPNLGAIEESAPAVNRVTEFFRSQNADVIDMIPLVLPQDRNRMIVNRFDNHPSVEANRLAAEALYAVLTASTESAAP